ncbi:LysM peptidoglycan-binding domain-containing protein [Belnapia sp. T6]|uniref:LysM peptidoglycan-binding domain-containing protein n=1 Tax=Belnapia mucosa TaxID=2804532 RepID=A0ABS1V1M9_9PROT|nr:LysM peptidoglycan-binding domain-containing protein [Belnapia mucosa]MBL6455609.1 LysM peptidoglycan-binding domain-containing protein [Belnapia mucosa]
MPSYEFPADAGLPLSGAGPEAITAHLDRLGLPHAGLRINRRGEVVTLEGSVADGDAAERLVLATGNLQGVARVEDKLTPAHTPGLLDSLGAFARLPAGAASTEAAETAMHQAQVETGTRFGPGRSLFHTMQPGETLAELAARHLGGDERRLMEANAPILAGTLPGPGMVIRIPPA